MLTRAPIHRLRDAGLTRSARRPSARLLTASLLLCIAVAGGLTAQTPAPAPAAPQTPAAPGGGTDELPADYKWFRSRSNVFQLGVPAGWRQLAPGEVQQLAAANPDLPHDLLENEPTLFYAIGDVDAWLRGRFDGVYVYVVEQDNEWQIDDRLDDRLAAMWHKKGQNDGIDYRIEDVRRTEFGLDRDPGVTCVRTITPPAGAAQKSIDLYIPTGGRELTLCLTCWAADFPREEPRLRNLQRWLSLARKAHGTGTLQDRLWTPAITGGVVGLILLLLYRHSRRRAV